MTGQDIKTDEVGITSDIIGIVIETGGISDNSDEKNSESASPTMTARSLKQTRIGPTTYMRYDKTNLLNLLKC